MRVLTSLLMVVLSPGFAPHRYSAQVHRPSTESSEPAAILASYLSYGIGENPLNSPLIKDPINARILIAARNGVRYDELLDYLLAVSWTPLGADTLGEIGGSWRAVYRSALAGKPIDDNAAAQLRRIGLSSEHGRVLIPVVKRTDPLYGLLRQVALSYLGLLKSHLHLQRLAAVMGTDEKYAWAVAYHDVSWELLRLMVNRGEFKRPGALGPQERKGAAPSMVGTFAVVEAYPPFVKMLENALRRN